MALINAAAFDLTVNGTGFVAGSSVLFNGASLTTTFQSATSLKATVPASSLTAAADVPVNVQNPGSKVSAPIVFHIQYPSPTASAISPSSLAAGSSPTEILVVGTGFVKNSQIAFNGAPAATTFVDATHVKATASASQLASAQLIAVTVFNPYPGGGTSAGLTLTVANGTPSITSLNPSAVAVGSPDKTITIYGSGFVSTSSVTSNGFPIASTYVSGSQLTATIPSNHMANYGSVTIIVTNPQPGGGPSQPAKLTVACDTSGVDYVLGTLNATTTVNTNFGGAAMMSRWSESGSCTTVALYTDVQQPGRYVIVQNTTGTSITLSAWADCSTVNSGDAFLTFYRRPTVPANDNDRLGCAFVVSEGTNGSGGYASPESGGSAWCPGLTKSNGGGLQLGVCERAVVFIQPYDNTSSSFAPPPRLRLKPEPQ
jgi:hypothetical protein